MSLISMMILVSFNFMRRFIVLIAMTCLLGLEAGAVELVRDGKAVGSIVVPAHPLAVESYAAKEVQYHVERATGAKLPIVGEGEETGAKSRVYLGKCVAAANIHLEASSLPGNSYIVKSAGGDLYIVGKDGRGDPLNRDTHEGTLFGVYDILEDDMQVRWLWPGQLGEVIPRRDNLALAPVEGIVQPRLWFKEWRGDLSEGERVWLKRQRFGRSIQPNPSEFLAAYQSLRDFRQANQEYDKTSFAGLRGAERTWEQASR
jgi:hypothetical protein